MNPDFNPDANPFESILQGFGGSPAQAPSAGSAPQVPPALLAAMQQGGMPGGAPSPEQGGAPAPQGMPMGGMPGMPEVEQSSNAPGSNPGGSKHLISALQSLQKFITESSDQQEIQAARILTGILGKLIDRDQQNQQQKEQGQPQPGMGGMPGGAPQMPPMPGM